MWVEVLTKIKDLFVSKKDELNDLDQAIGDGDHGTNMVRGLEAVLAEPNKITSLPSKQVLMNIAMILLSKVGGSSGPLFSTALMKMSQTIDDSNSQQNWYDALVAGFEGIKMRGKSDVGEKTLLDSYNGLLIAFKENISLPWSELLPKLVKATNDAALATKDLLATKGRASYLKERSIGHIDPGAASIALIVEAVSEVVK